jgi:hypothetical protein
MKEKNRHNRPLTNGCVTGKLCFNSRSQAKVKAKYVSGAIDKSVRIYRCPICTMWHLTSKQKWITK